jgi:hypothetical protein
MGPPAALTCSRPPEVPNTILLSRVQNPPWTADATARSVCTGPPDTSIFWSLPGVLNTMYRLSGDQKGRPPAPVVPTKGRASTASKDRTHNWSIPPEEARNASLRPSGESATLL